MHRFTTPLALAVTLAGCSADSPTDPLVMSGAPAYAAVPVPFKARCELEIQPATPVGPGLIHQIDFGTCQATHLGRATFVSDKIINVVAGTQTVEATFTAANGDVLTGTGAGTSQLVGPGRVAFTATIAFTGGTGRFADATGQATLTGEADLVAMRSHMSATGSLEY